MHEAPALRKTGYAGTRLVCNLITEWVEVRGSVIKGHFQLCGECRPTWVTRDLVSETNKQINK